MKIRELKFWICETKENSTWPPNWECWSSPKHRCIHGDNEPSIHEVVSNSTLVEVKRFQNYDDVLNLRTYYKDANGIEHNCTINLKWMQPPTVADVEKILRIQLGISGSAIGDLEVYLNPTSMEPQKWFIA
jgi:hypothetical protein